MERLNTMNKKKKDNGGLLLFTAAIGAIVLLSIVAGIIGHFGEEEIGLTAIYAVCWLVLIIRAKSVKKGLIRRIRGLLNSS